jgi:hypothetical protein
MPRKRARYGVVLVVAMLGLVIALRMLFGPFDAPVRVRIPLNPAGWFGLGLTILLATKDGRIGNCETPQQGPSGWWSVAVIAAALIGFTTAAFWRSLRLYFLSDDFILVKLANTSHLAIRPLFATPGGDGFFRPIGNISLILTAMFAGVNPMAWHSMALILHIANVLLVFTLATWLCASRLAASFAAALFAIHGTRPETAVWIAGRFDLVATLFVLAGLLFFIRSYEAASTGDLYALASLVCMVLAILSKESAYIFPLLLVAFLIAKRDLSRRRLGVLIPFFITAVALFAYRWWLFGGIGGYRDPHTGQSQVLTLGFSTLKALALRLWTALYFPINWSKEPGTWLTALMLLYMGALIWLAAKRRYLVKMVFPLGFVLISALPPLHLLVIGSELGNSRLLYLPSVGFCIMVAVAADGLRGRARWIIPSVILAFHFVALQHNLDLWEYASAKAKATSVAARNCIVPGVGEIAVSGIPSILQGVPFFANGLFEAIELQRSGAPFTMIVRAVLDDRPTSQSLVWNRMTETADCVRQGKHPGY